MTKLPDSHLLREIDALRECLADCLHRLDHVERRLDAAHVGDAPRVEQERGRPNAIALGGGDPFERALPRSENGSADEPPALAVPRRIEIDTPPRADTEASRVETGANGFTIRAVSLPPDFHTPPPQAPLPSEAPPAGTLHESRWDPRRSSGDGSPDPFAFLDLPTTREDVSETYRGMHALLGGLDVTTPDEVA